MIRFLLNDEEVCLPDCAADQTVLAYLREDKGLCGTKEGCASGDCGACTVVVAERQQPATGGLDYKAINSCITFLGALHGRQVITVEHLAQDGQLHPVQQAMVDHHGSQCGFCTPGFVMSMYAMYQQRSGDSAATGPVTREQVCTGLAGNLCRCTGYRPIIDAALQSLNQPVIKSVADDTGRTADRLQAMTDSGPVNGDTIVIPQSAADLAQSVQCFPGARLLAGGTDLALEVTQQLQSLDRIILVDRVAELNQVSVNEQTLELGAAVSLSRCEAVFANEFPEISHLLSRFGSTQIRTQGTIGGNIANASPIGDLPPVLMALGAELVLQSVDSTRNVPVDSFFTGYRRTLLQAGEFIRTIVIMRPSPQQVFRVYKISKRIDDDISAVCLAINLTVDDDKRIQQARIAAGGMAEVPRRAQATEQAMVGQLLDEALIKTAQSAICSDFSPISDARASAEYRIQVTQNLLARFLFDWRQEQPLLQVEHLG